jgi:hypothetical protein
MLLMAVAPKKLDVHAGDLLEIEDHRYELVPDRRGGLTLEPAVITKVSELDRRHGTRPATEEEIEAQFGRLPRDGEG